MADCWAWQTAALMVCTMVERKAARRVDLWDFLLAEKKAVTKALNLVVCLADKTAVKKVQRRAALTAVTTAELKETRWVENLADLMVQLTADHLAE